MHTVIEERYNLLNAWLSDCPGGDRCNLRRLYLLNTNYADLLLIFATSMPGNPATSRSASPISRFLK